MVRIGRGLLLVTAILLSAAATVAGARWRDIGSGLPRSIPAVKSLAIDSATPSTLYAVDWYGRLFKSIDSGGSWTVRGSVAGVYSVAVDPTNSSTVYAVAWRGVLKSRDGGETWAAADSGLTGLLYASGIAVDPRTPATLYATTTKGVFKSTDAARSWKKLETVPPKDYYFWGKVTIVPINPSIGPGRDGHRPPPGRIDAETIYFAYDAGNSDQGILKSTDGGQSWNSISGAPGFGVLSLVVDPISPSTLYAPSRKADGSILKSNDGGQTWTVHTIAPSNAPVTSLAVDPVSSSTFYAIYFNYWGGGSWGLLKSMDSGETWSALDTGLPPYSLTGVDPPFLAVSPTTPATVYIGYFDRDLPSGHLAKSTDGGVNWNAVDAGLTYVDVHAVAVDPVNPSKIYAGMGGSVSNIPLFKSTLGGASWTSLAQFELGGQNSYSWVSFLLVDPVNPNSIYAAANGNAAYGAVFKTTDGGANWSGANIRTILTTVMALDATDSKTVYLGDYNNGGDADAMLRKSADGGSTWTLPYDWPIGPLNTLAIDPGNRATLYAGTPEGIFQSADGGASWSNHGLSMGVTALALDLGDPNTIYAATGNFNAAFLGLFKSTDGGANWAPINSGLAKVLDSRSTVTAIAFAPGDGGTLYAATSGCGIYKSLDSGANWAPVNEGLSNLDVRLLAVASNALYAVTTSGIFKAAF